jgi:phage shock protein A
VTDILGRMGNILRANVTAMIDGAEDPQTMRDLLIHDFDRTIADAEQAVAQVTGNLRDAEANEQKAADEATTWGTRAQAAAAKAVELEKAGSADAARFNDLARTALREQVGSEVEQRRQAALVAQRTILTGQLKDGLNRLRERREQLAQSGEAGLGSAEDAMVEARLLALKGPGPDVLPEPAPRNGHPASRKRKKAAVAEAAAS